eukprot:1765503-Rhodomonas_salina.2
MLGVSHPSAFHSSSPGIPPRGTQHFRSAISRSCSSDAVSCPRRVLALPLSSRRKRTSSHV